MTMQLREIYIGNECYQGKSEVAKHCTVF